MHKVFKEENQAINRAALYSSIYTSLKLVPTSQKIVLEQLKKLKLGLVNAN
jgi:hypothetical protein